MGNRKYLKNGVCIEKLGDKKYEVYEISVWLNNGNLNYGESEKRSIYLERHAMDDIIEFYNKTKNF